MYVIIGQGAAGVSAAKTLKALDPGLPVTMLSDESDWYYSRIDLPDIIKGKIECQSATLIGRNAFDELGITCRMNERVRSILPLEKSVELDSGERISYEKLLLATGSTPILPDIAGRDGEHVFTLWTLDDARRIVEASARARDAVVIGAGLIGIKTALALQGRGLSVTLIERLPRVMPRQLDDTASDMVAQHLRDQGITVYRDTRVDAVKLEQGRVAGVQARGLIPCDMVICAVGVRPNTQLAVEAGLKVDDGIVTDDRLCTSDPAIFAAGDCAQSVDPLTGKAVIPAIWPVAVDQGRHAAYTMKGKSLCYRPGVARNSVDIAGLPLVSFGDIFGSREDLVMSDHEGTKYRKLVSRGHALRGVLCIGDIRQAGVLGNLVLRQTPLHGLDPLSPRFSAADLVQSTRLPHQSLLHSCRHTEII